MHFFFTDRLSSNPKYINKNYLNVDCDRKADDDFQYFAPKQRRIFLQENYELSNILTEGN